MVSVDKIERGFASFVDQDIAPNLSCSTVKGLAISVGAAVLSKRMGTALASLKGNDMLMALGMVDSQGNVDIDIVKEELMKKMTAEGIKLEVPMIGELVFSREDIERLYRRIMEA